MRGGSLWRIKYLDTHVQYTTDTREQRSATPRPHRCLLNARLLRTVSR